MKYQIRNLPKQQAGFSLVEIAIVLVIIGVLFGGALQGRQMIQDSKVKRIQGDADQIAAAINLYKDRFNALPGDDPNANANVGGSTPPRRLAGNGQINGAWASTRDRDESRKIWEHLRLAKLIKGGSGYDQPTHSFGGRIGAQTNAWNALRGNVLCFENISGEIAKQIEAKYDSGNATDPRGTGTWVSGNRNAGLYNNNSNYTMCTPI